MDPITNNQPTIEVVDLTSDESDDSLSGDASMEGEPIESEFVSASIRYHRYLSQYHDLFSNFLEDACGLHMSAMDGCIDNWETTANAMIERWIYEIMDLDLRNHMDMDE